MIAAALLSTTLSCGTSSINERDKIHSPQKSEANYRASSDHTGNYGEEQFEFPAAIKWKFFNTSKGVISSPVVSNNTLYFGSFDRYLYALDATNGNGIWRFRSAGSIVVSPVVDNGEVYFGSMDGSFYSLNQVTGGKLWSFQTAAKQDAKGNFSDQEGPISSATDVKETELNQITYRLSQTEGMVSSDGILPDKGISSTPVIDNGIIYFGTFGNRLYALNAANGKEVWEFRTNYEINFSPAVSNGIVYFSTGSHLIALDAATGKKKWERPIANGVGASPVIAGGIVLYDDGVHLLALEAKTGQDKWSVEVGNEYGPDGGVSVKDGMVFLGNDQKFQALDLTTGKQVWENDSIRPASTGIPPAIAGNCVYFIDLAGNIDSLDSRTGQINGRFKIQDGFDPKWKTATIMSISNGVIYLGSMNGNVYAIQGGSSANV
ncbi:MAG: outer membrane protein assembly factor BamB family protein [Thermoleophilia bacterium]